MIDENGVEIDIDEPMSIKQKSMRKIYNQWDSKGNYFIVILLATVSFLFAFVRFDNAAVTFMLPNYDNAFGWIVFVFMTMLPAVIGLLIKATLRRQGIKLALGEQRIRELQREYNNLLTVKSVALRPPRNILEYQKSALLKESLFTICMVAITTTLMVGVALSGGWEGVLKQLINFVMWAIFGLKSMIEANDYVLNEYSQWLIIHIKELKSDTQEKE